MNDHLFKNRAFQEEYEQNGYFLTNFFESDVVQKIRTDFHTLFDIGDKDGYYNTGFIDDVALKTKIYDYLMPYGESLVEQFLVDYKVLSLNFVVKKTEHSKAYLHQDFPYSDERKYPTFYFWFPLQDVDFDNGALHVAPQTHKIPFPFRGINVADVLHTHQIELDVNDLTCLTMKEGELVVFDSRIVHGSPPNTTPNSRISVLICAVPAHETAFLYKYDSKNKVLGKYTADKEFMTHFVAHSGKLPEVAHYIGEEPDFIESHELDRAELLTILKQKTD